MAITYTWDVVQMDVYPEKDGFTDVVYMTHWTLSGTDNTYTGSAYGTAGIALNEQGSYIPYEDLTQEQVLGWVKNSLGEEQVALLEAKIATQIANQANPPVITPPLPWLLNTN
jgi:hypothetical protein